MNYDDYLEHHGKPGLALLKQDKVNEVCAMVVLLGAKQPNGQSTYRIDGRSVLLKSKEYTGRWFVDREEFIKLTGGYRDRKD